MTIVNGYRIEPRVDFRRADLRGANIGHARFDKATNLTAGSNFVGANLREAYIVGADIHARFDKATNLIAGSNFVRANIEYILKD